MSCDYDTTKIQIPGDVPPSAAQEYCSNYQAITRGKNRLVLFACDQKIEHLNRDFYGPNIDIEDNNPEHMFTIAQNGNIGAFATHLGLIFKYGKKYSKINYIVKVNGKTDLVKTEQKDPISKQLWSVEQIVEFKHNACIPIVGVGYTLYLGSEHEATMLQEAAQLIVKAHQHGLITILWMYPRGKSVPDERSGELIAGVAGVALSLGSDFAKINLPSPSLGKTSQDWLKIAAQAAGQTKILVSGGNKVDEKTVLSELYNQIHQGTIAGAAIGRNIHQRNLQQAIQLTNAISAIVYENKTINEALTLI